MANNDNLTRPPPHNPDKNRSKIINIRCSPKEHATIRTNADLAGFAVGAFLRAAGTGDAGPRAKRRPTADHIALRQILGQIQRTGNNINQIARALNSRQQASIPELRKALSAYMETRDAIFEALGKEPKPTRSIKPPKPRKRKPERKSP